MGSDGEAVRALREVHILSAGGVSEAVSTWRLYQIMRGAIEEPRYVPDDVEVALRKAARSILEDRRGVSIRAFPGDLAFEGPFEVTKPWIVVEGGSTAMQEGDVLMIEMPSRRSYDMVWRNNYDVIVPVYTAGKAQVRMDVTGAARAAIWLLGDNGAIDEFHFVERDEDAIASLRESCLAAIARVEAGEEPAPDDDEVGEYLSMPGRKNSERVLGPADPITDAFEEWQRARAAESEANASARALKEQSRKPEGVLKRALAETPTLIMPSGQIVTCKHMVQPVAATVRRFDKIVVSKPAKAS